MDPKWVDIAMAAKDVAGGLHNLSEIYDEVIKNIKTMEVATKLTKREAADLIEALEFLQAQVDMQKHYWELMEKGMVKPVAIPVSPNAPLATPKAKGGSNSAPRKVYVNPNSRYF